MSICELHNISKSFKTKKIFDNFSLSIKKNEQVCITGESGSGKSTLLNIIGLLDSPDNGTVNICGVQNVQANSKKSQILLRNKIGFLFQNFGLIDDKTIGYNLDIACKNSKIPKKKWKEKQIEVLNDLKLKLPLNENIYNLSGGEQQRIAMARILLKDCDIILADEPTGSLDVLNRDIVLNILDKLNDKGKTILIVTHDPYIVSKSHRVINL